MAGTFYAGKPLPLPREAFLPGEQVSRVGSVLLELGSKREGRLSGRLTGGRERRVVVVTFFWREDPAKGCRGLEVPLIGLTYACPEELADLWTFASREEVFTLAFPPGVLQGLPPERRRVWMGVATSERDLFLLRGLTRGIGHPHPPERVGGVDGEGLPRGFRGQGFLPPPPGPHWGCGVKTPLDPQSGYPGEPIRDQVGGGQTGPSLAPTAGIS